MLSHAGRRAHAVAPASLRTRPGPRGKAGLRWTTLRAVNIPALLFPEIALIAIGWALYRSGRFSDAFWSGAERLVYFVLFPALLFGALVRNPVSIGASAPMLLAALGAFRDVLLNRCLFDVSEWQIGDERSFSPHRHDEVATLELLIGTRDRIRIDEQYARKIANRRHLFT